MRQTSCVPRLRDKKIHGPLSPLHSLSIFICRCLEEKLWMTQDRLCDETGNTDVLMPILQQYIK